MQTIPGFPASRAPGSSSRASLLPSRLGDIRQDREHQRHLLEPEQHPSARLRHGRHREPRAQAAHPLHQPDHCTQTCQQGGHQARCQDRAEPRQEDGAMGGEGREREERQAGEERTPTEIVRPRFQESSAEEHNGLFGG